MSAAAPATPPASSDRTIHGAILTALALGTQGAKEEALRAALRNWQGDGESGIKSPHLLVHIFKNLYELDALPQAFINEDSTDFRVLQKVCKEFNFKLLFADVNKVYGGVVFVDHKKKWTWARSRPKFENHHVDIFIDRLTLEHVVDVHEESSPGRIPLRCEEILQKSPFTYRAADVKTCEGSKSMSSRMEYGLWHFHEETMLVITPPQHISVYEVRQCFAISERRSWVDPEDGDLWDEYGPDEGVQHADSKTITQLLDRATGNAPKSAAGQAEKEKIQEMCELFFGYHDRIKPNKTFWREDPASFPLLPKEGLEHLTAVSMEYSSQDLWRKAVGMLKTEANLTAQDLCYFLHQSLHQDNLRKASYLVKNQDESSNQLLQPEALTAWRVSTIRKALAVSKMKDWLTIIQADRELKDDQLIQKTLQQVSKGATPSDIATCLQRMIKLKDEIPAIDLHKYCETILSAHSEGSDQLGLSELKAIVDLLNLSLPLSKTAIRDYCKKILRRKVKYRWRSDSRFVGEYISPCIIVGQKLGEEGLHLLVPLLATFADDIPWLLKLLIQVKSSGSWTSDTFLPKLTNAALEPAVDKLIPAPSPGSKSVYFGYTPKSTPPVQDTNRANATVTKYELKLFIQLLKDMGLDETVDRFTDKMAQSGKFGVDRFRDVLGEEKTPEFGMKRKAVELEESQKKKKGRPVVKDGKFVTVYD